MNAPLVLKDFNGVIEITSDAYELKRSALAKAKPIARVETPEQQLIAVEALRELKAVRAGMETTRKSVKAPVLQLGREIDEKAHDFMVEIDKQYMRLIGMISHYQKKLAEVKAQEQAKIERGQQDAQSLRKSAQELRMQSVLEHKPELLTEAEQLEKKAFDLEMNAEVALVPVIDKPRGLVVRDRINFQVIDAIIFCQAYPQYFKWNPDTETLKLDRMGILDELNREDGKGLHQRDGSGSSARLEHLYE